MWSGRGRGDKIPKRKGAKRGGAGAECSAGGSGCCRRDGASRGPGSRKRLRVQWHEFWGLEADLLAAEIALLSLGVRRGRAGADGDRLASGDAEGERARARAGELRDTRRGLFLERRALEERMVE